MDPLKAKLLYQAIHLLGLFALFVSIGGLAMHAMNGGTKESNPHRKWPVITHGVGLFLVLLGGFGMLAKVTPLYPEMYASWPWWLYVKLVIWLFLGTAPLFFYRMASWSKTLWFAFPLLGATAAGLAIFRNLL